MHVGDVKIPLTVQEQDTTSVFHDLIFRSPFRESVVLREAGREVRDTYNYMSGNDNKRYVRSTGYGQVGRL